jgi:hypothetical protein
MCKQTGAELGVILLLFRFDDIKKEKKRKEGVDLMATKLNRFIRVFANNIK